MATKKILVDLDLSGNEIQNPVIQNLATAPASPKEGQIYFNTTSHTYYGYKNGGWVLLDSQGMAYAAGTGIDSTAFNNGTIQVSTTIASKTDIGSANLTIQRNGTGIGTFSANATSPTTVNISVPTTATEVGALPSDTIIGDGKAIFKKNGTAFATITANQTSTINVDYTIPTAVTDLSDASNYALKSDVASAVIPKGSISSVSNLPTLTSDHRGWMYNFSAEFTTTSDFVEGSGKKYPVGTNVVVVEYTSGTYKYDVFAGFIDTTAIDNHIADTTIHVTATDKTTWNGKQDALTFSTGLTNTSGTVTVNDYNKLLKNNATSGLAIGTNSSCNHNSSLALGNGAETTASREIQLGAGTNATQGSMQVWTYKLLDATSGLIPDARISSGIKNGASAGATAAQTYTDTNPALTQTGGVCTWTVTHNLGANVVASVYDATTNEEVITTIEKTSSTVATVKFNSTANITADTYRVVVIGK